MLGRSNNLAAGMESTVSNDQRQIELTVELAASLQRLLTDTDDADEILLRNRQL